MKGRTKKQRKEMYGQNQTQGRVKENRRNFKKWKDVEEERINGGIKEERKE